MRLSLSLQFESFVGDWKGRFLGHDQIWCMHCSNLGGSSEEKSLARADRADLLRCSSEDAPAYAGDGGKARTGLTHCTPVRCNFFIR
jgi:hypothetical protein